MKVKISMLFVLFLFSFWHESCPCFSQTGDIDAPIQLIMKPLLTEFEQFGEISFEVSIRNLATTVVDIQPIKLNIDPRLGTAWRLKSNELLLSLSPVTDTTPILQIEAIRIGEIYSGRIRIPYASEPSCVFNSLCVSFPNTTSKTTDNSEWVRCYMNKFLDQLNFVWCSFFMSGKFTITADLAYHYSAKETEKINYCSSKFDIIIKQSPWLAFFGGIIGCFFWVIGSWAMGVQSTQGNGIRGYFSLFFKGIVAISIFIMVSDQFKGKDLPISFEIRNFWGGLALGLFFPKVSDWVLRNIFDPSKPS